MGISARHVVVGLDGIEGDADHRLQTFETGADLQREPRADLRAGVCERIERRERVAHHRVEVEPPDGLI